MSDATAGLSAPASKSGGKDDLPSQIYLVSYPKYIFLYPTFIASLIAGIALLVTQAEPASGTSHFISMAFLAIFVANLFVITFDFPRTTSLTLFFFFVALDFRALVVLVLVRFARLAAAPEGPPGAATGAPACSRRNDS